MVRGERHERATIPSGVGDAICRLIRMYSIGSQPSRSGQSYNYRFSAALLERGFDTKSGRAGKRENGKTAEQQSGGAIGAACE
jgi:hypothetical protein